jgi:phosphoglucosamine mutase
MHTELLRERVKREGADLGLALDGDADRCILVDELGEEVDGDHVLGILATKMHERGELRDATVVGTVMSNLGLEVALRERGIRLARTPVGDRYVVEEMRNRNLNLGGEQSGHVVCLDHTTTGDGMITALLIATCVLRSGKPLYDLKQVVRKFPQALISLRVREKRDFAGIDAVASSISRAESALGDRGRVLVRYSGTEPLARVMVEGESEALVDEHAQSIAQAIRAQLG